MTALFFMLHTIEFELISKLYDVRSLRSLFTLLQVVGYLLSLVQSLEAFTLDF